MAKYKIMSFDGGGIRGALSAKILERLVDYEPALLENVNLLAGTSSGAFIALGLAYGLKPPELVELYSMKNGRFIFTPEYSEILRPKYNNEHLKEVLGSIFPPDLKLKDLKKQVLIPVFCLNDAQTNAWNPVFLHNCSHSDFLEMPVLDAALASSAAPIYFPSYQNYIDGGVVANNPSTAAIAFARDEAAGNQPLDDICLLSVSTGYSPAKITEDTTDWGALEWMLSFSPPIPLLTILLDSAVEADTYYSRQLLGKHYFRINPLLPKSIYLDDYNQIPALLSLAKKYHLKPALNWLRANWY
ncbi:MAG: patatin-like phospholipase family protein [Peptococcaceae bacterium]